MYADAWTLSMIVALRGWYPDTLLLLDMLAEVVTASAGRRHHPGCRCPRA